MLKKQVKTAPTVSFKLLSARTLVKRCFPAMPQKASATERVRHWHLSESVAAACAARHEDPTFREKLHNLISDTSRWAVLNVEEVPLDATAPQAPVKQRKPTARKGHDQHFAAEML